MKPILDQHSSAGEIVGNAEAGRDISGIQYPIRYSRSRVHRPSSSILRKNRILTDKAALDVAYSYKLLRTHVFGKLQGTGYNSIAVLAGRSGEGATLTAINLAISIALDPRATVLLIDLNLRNPSIHRYFGFEPAVGVADVLTSSARLEDALFNPDIEGLLVLPGRSPISGSSELLATQAAANFVRDVRSRYSSRIVIFDLPPLLEAEDAIVAMPFYDASVVVIRDCHCQRDDLLRMAELLNGKPIVGTVLNNAKY